MTLKEFEALEEVVKANAVWDGKFVSSYVVDDVFVQRYGLDGFDVEVYYDPLKNEILRVNPI